MKRGENDSFEPLMQGTFLLPHRVLRALNLIKINDNIVLIINS